MGFKNIDEVISYFSKNDANEIYFKFLAANDNAKNQLYLGKNFGALQIFKNLVLKPDEKNEKILKASLNFFWISDDLKEQNKAPFSQLIFYPQYPEVRLSGFLRGAINAPSKLMDPRARMPDRILIFGVKRDGKVLAIVLPPTSPLSPILSLLKSSVINQLVVPGDLGDRGKVLKEMKRISNLGWIDACRMNPEGNLVPSAGSNSGGNTLEAMLGIKSNGFSEPDFCGWEVKQFGVKNFEKIKGGPITLFTPEPDSGIYVTEGAKHFIKTYGYEDKSGKPRINFSSPHKFNVFNENTGLTLKLEGFDLKTKKITDVDGGIVLRDKKNKIAAKWDFKSLMEHWNKKHNLAVYVPGMKQVKEDRLQYKYSDRVYLGEKTDFLLFLIACTESKIYYDPGIKLELGSDKMKRRSQFRIKFDDIEKLYQRWTKT